MKMPHFTHQHAAVFSILVLAALVVALCATKLELVIKHQYDININLPVKQK